MESLVEGARPPRPQKKARKQKPPNSAEENPGDDDEFEHPELKVPRSALDGCESSFKAADDRRQKGSTQFFDTTAIMGLLCRHDRPLWLANMTSAGEKQHYVLALVDEFFQNVPTWFRIGILYDIGCQLHRTCLKWGFLLDYLPRIEFGISVFHAYGHGWACQCTYHPRKRPGFGLTDGEGCERFWSSIRGLISNLRVCGVRVFSFGERI
jgi:hypothetical protein